MARRDKRHNTVNKQPSPALPSPINQPLPSPSAPNSTGSTYKRWALAVWAHIGGIAFVLSAVTLWYTHHQVQTNRDQLDELKRQNDWTEYNSLRAAGAVTAQVEIAGIVASPKSVPKELIVNDRGAKDEKGKFVLRPHFKDLDTLLRGKPVIVLNNVGEEPIEAIRIVTRLHTFEYEVLDRAVPKDDFGSVIREEEREDFTLRQQWLPESSVRLSLVKGLLAQMMQIQNTGNENLVLKAILQVHVSAKISGGTIFGGNTDRQYIACRVSWLPSGFPTNRCREILDGYQSRVVFGKRYEPKQARQVDNPLDPKHWAVK